jgi:uncharacterized protein (UPF0333 family)
MKKGQVSLEFVIIIGVILILSVFFADLVFGTTDSTKSIAKIKLRTLDLITINDSNAFLLKVDSVETNSDLNLTLYLKNGQNLNLSDVNYLDTIINIRQTTYYQNINLSFIYN